jgi:type IV pilus assembly protein PilP
MSRHRRLAPFVLPLALAGCADPELGRLDRELSSIRSDPGEVARVELPEIPEFEPVPYDEADLRSPFMDHIPEEDESPEGSEDLAPDLTREREPLEAFDRGELELVGTLTVDGEPSALVQAPDGQVHRLRVGNYLGSDFGRIVGITEASIQLVEVVSTGRGGWIERNARMTLQDD